MENFIFYKKRQKQIVIMRLDGKTYQQIGDSLGVHRSRVQKIENQKIIFDNYYQQPSVFDNLPKWMKKGNSRVRYLARMRDNFTCQACGLIWEKGQRQFDCHHLDGLCGKKSKGYDKIGEIGKLITLCHKCHFNRHDHSRFLST